jgi:hypothetical protein
MHKPDCVTRTPELKVAFSKSKGALKEVVGVVTRNMDIPFFSLEPRRTPVPPAAELQSFASFAASQRAQKGRGILLLHFDSMRACEDAATNISLPLVRSIAKNLPIGMNVGFVLWPLDRNEDTGKFSRENLSTWLGKEPLLQSVVDVMSVADRVESSMVPMCVSIAPTPENTSATQILWVPFKNVQTAGRPCRTLRTQDESSALGKRIMSDAEYAECRELFRVMQREVSNPGVWWIRHLTRPGASGYMAKELTVVTPHLLKEAC